MHRTLPSIALALSSGLLLAACAGGGAATTVPTTSAATTPAATKPAATTSAASSPLATTAAPGATTAPSATSPTAVVVPVAPSAAGRAVLRDVTGNVVGFASFSQAANGVLIDVLVSGMSPGNHGIHVHEVGKCDAGIVAAGASPAAAAGTATAASPVAAATGTPASGAAGTPVPPFTSAGGHLNPNTRQHGFQNPQGPHAGDLPNIAVRANGTGVLQFVDPMVALAPATATTPIPTTTAGPPAPLFGTNGSALVVHAGPDDERTDPAGNSGARIACGVIEQVPVPTTAGAAATTATVPSTGASAATTTPSTSAVGTTAPSTGGATGAVTTGTPVSSAPPPPLATIPPVATALTGGAGVTAASPTPIGAGAAVSTPSGSTTTAITPAAVATVAPAPTIATVPTVASGASTLPTPATGAAVPLASPTR